AACTAAGTAPVPPRTAPVAPAADPRVRAALLDRAKREAVEWVVAADPRLAQRLHVTASDGVIKQIGLEAVLAEDATAQIRGPSLDLFAFRARGKALEHAAGLLAPFADAAAGFPDRDLLARLIEEERARTADEANLDESSGELVRGVLSTWTPPASPGEWPERDAWISRHLLEIRDSLRSDRPRTGPVDLDEALYPLERLLAPLQFPRGAAAIAEVRIALDADRRTVPALATPDRIQHGVRVYLGLEVDAPALPASLEALEAALYERAKRAVAAAPSGPPAAHTPLFVDAECGAPPERVAICGLQASLAGQPVETRLVVLHDDVLLALAAVTRAPPPRTRLLSGPDDDVIGSLERAARERPIVALGVALAADILVRYEDVNGLNGWSGDAPLDLVVHALDEQRSGRTARGADIRFDAIAAKGAAPP
ncbi:MAG: hypothetical protein FWD17_08465, partial [Polyangiaceae bacterium]|nr:hypothetical protein [Polyangiaceae bacterium]